MEIETLINDHLRYGYAVANRVGWTLPRDERNSVAHLALVEAAWAWLPKKESEQGEFKFYLAKIVERMVLRAMSSVKRQTSRNDKDSLFARMMFEFAEARERRVSELQQGELAELAEVIRAKGYSTSIERLKGTQVGFSDTETSLNMSVYVDRSCTFADVLTYSRGWRMNPEAILIAKEEAVECNRYRRSPEKEQQLFQSWVLWLPKEQRQVMSHRYLWNGKEGACRDFQHFCSVRYGGTARSTGLAMTPIRAEVVYTEAVETLRDFARGNFSSASFEFVLKNVPQQLVERFVDTVEDPMAKMALRYRFLTFYGDTTVTGGKVYQTKGRPTLSTLTRVWHKRLEKKAGHTLEKEEAKKMVTDAFEKVCRKLAVQIGIAPPDVLKKKS